MSVEKKIGILALLTSPVLFWKVGALDALTFLIGAFLSALHFHFLARSIRSWVSDENEKKGMGSVFLSGFRHLIILGLLGLLVVWAKLKLSFLMAGFLVLVIAIVWEGLKAPSE
ncbi:MAG: hypothetical protein JNK65_08880 [Deltaproteobacteria bacterium]|nr:hypothetical protein [Deltaproteobacteria bacterium]